MNVLVFAASNSRQSINRTLADFAATRLRARDADVEISTLDINDFEMPIFSIDREKEVGVHPLAQSLFDRIGAADALVISFPEHNGLVPAAWKNIFDWMSRIDKSVWQGKPLVVLAATPGPRAGAGVLGSQEDQAPRFGADLRGRLGIGKWGEAWDNDAGALANPEDLAALDAVLAKLL